MLRIMYFSLYSSRFYKRKHYNGKQRSNNNFIDKQVNALPKYQKVTKNQFDLIDSATETLKILIFSLLNICIFICYQKRWQFLRKFRKITSFTDYTLSILLITGRIILFQQFQSLFRAAFNNIFTMQIILVQIQDWWMSTHLVFNWNNYRSAVDCVYSKVLETI